MCFPFDSLPLIEENGAQLVQRRRGKTRFKLIIEIRKLTVASDESSKILVSGGFLLLLNKRLQSFMLLFDADVECRSSSL